MNQFQAGLGLRFHRSPNPKKWLLLLPLPQINVGKEVFTGKREECQGKCEWLEPRRECFFRSRGEKIFLKPRWWRGRGDKSWLEWKGGISEKEGREEGKWGEGAEIHCRLTLSPDPPHEAHCSYRTGPIIWFVSRQIITQPQPVCDPVGWDETKFLGQV